MYNAVFCYVLLQNALVVITGTPRMRVQRTYYIGNDRFCVWPIAKRPMITSGPSSHGLQDTISGSRIRSSIHPSSLLCSYGLQLDQLPPTTLCLHWGVECYYYSPFEAEERAFLLYCCNQSQSWIAIDISCDWNCCVGIPRGCQCCCYCCFCC